MEYYERLYEAVSQHLCGLHQKKGASFLSMGQELGLAKETVRKIARRDYKPGGGPDMQSLIIIQSYYHIPTVGQVEEMTEDLVQDIKFLKEYLPFFNEQERESFKEEIRDLYEKKKLQGEIADF
ncbi:MAG: hypothetical protein SOS94_00740 [Lachnospiraceae bacterium]|nr:hypothetical protein [Bacillota bacterium]MDD7252809.1 hypothetical protein [Bacillota bacterium]MDY2948428.1 hypothetical protein [Lachnospiraceae bacterium]